MSLITSRHNSAIKHIRKLQSSRKARRKAQQYVVEGRRLVAEALSASTFVHSIVICEEYLENQADFAQQVRAFEAQKLFVSKDVFDSCSGTANGQGVIAVLSIAPASAISNDFALVVDDIADPGNLGTILRTAAAAGVDCVYMSPNTVDFLSPKVLRSGMGAHFRLPIQMLTWDEIAVELGDHSVFIADVSQGLPYYEMQSSGRMALVVSNEADGASNAAQALTSSRVHIPMANAVESLNVGVATGVLLLHMMRVRKGL